MPARATFERSGNQSQDAIRVRPDLIVPEAKDGEAAAAEVVVTNGIVCERMTGRVRIAIHLDSHARMKASKVNNICADSNLLAEMESTCTEGKQETPKPHLGCGRVGPKLSW